MARDGENARFATERLEASGRALAGLPQIASVLDVEQGYMSVECDVTRCRADGQRLHVSRDRDDVGESRTSLPS